MSEVTSRGTPTALSVSRFEGRHSPPLESSDEIQHVLEERDTCEYEGTSLLSRGHFIGQIVDDLAGIAGQAKMRAKLHLFDLHTHVEDFAKEVLNRVEHLNLINLNATHSNNPGLDLGDTANGIAFQITADKSGNKVRETLSKITPDQRSAFPKIRILVIGEKQGSYSLNDPIFASAGFSEDMIWDFNDVCAHIMALPAEDLEDLANYVSRETRRVRIELEIPDADGRFPTNIEAFLESLPKPRASDGTKMVAYYAGQLDELDPYAAKEALDELIADLLQLPRLTREVFHMLVTRRDKDLTSGDSYRISDPKLRRIYRGADLDGDLALLIQAGLIAFNEPESYGEPAYWRIILPRHRDNFDLQFVGYAEENKIDLRKPLVLLDFSDF